MSAGKRSTLKILDTPSQWLSSWLSWLPLAMAALTVYVVVLRYAFGVGAITAQEGVVYLHAMLFMLGASCTLFADEHVRVDVFYRRFTARQKAWVNALGHIMFTVPLCAVIVLSSLGYVSESWMIKESSPEPGGIPAVYLLKTLIPLMAMLLTIQALAEVLRALSVLVGDSQDG